MALWQRGLQEMDAAVATAPENIGVLIPRGALLLQATMNMPPELALPLPEKAVGDYEHVLALQSSYFDTLGDHPKGELLFGLAEGFSRLANTEKARRYFNRLIADAPTSGQAKSAGVADDRLVAEESGPRLRRLSQVDQADERGSP